LYQAKEDGQTAGGRATAGRARASRAQRDRQACRPDRPWITIVERTRPRHVVTIAYRQHQQQNCCMTTSITVRDVPDETRDELAARAALTGRSLQEYLRARLVELAASPDAEALVARIRTRKAATGTSLSAKRILAHRDAGRR